MADNRGSQIVTIRFHRPVDSDIVNERFRDIRMLGIYKGGRMTWDPGGSVTLYPLVCEIQGVTDGVYYQVRVETTTNVTQPLANNEYLVLRWKYTGDEGDDFMEIISTADTPQDDDIVVGQVKNNTETYAERTTPDTHHLFLRVEATEPASLNVIVRAGVGHKGSVHLPIAHRILDLSGSEYSPGNIIYVYVDDDGVVYHKKTAADYVGRALLAKIIYPSGENKITNSIIEDVRSFITPPAIPDESSITRSSTGELKVKPEGIVDGVTIEEDSGKLQLKDLGITSIFGAWSSNDSLGNAITRNTTYKATSDGLVFFRGTSGHVSMNYYTGSSKVVVDAEDLSVLRTRDSYPWPGLGVGGGCAIRKNDYWRADGGANGVFSWLPIGSGQCVKQ